MKKRKRPKKPTTKNFLVIAVYADNLQRYATKVEAASPEEAEVLAQQVCKDDNQMDADDPYPLIIAGVLCGRTDEETETIEVVA